MSIPSKRALQRARERIHSIRASLGGIELICSGTLSERWKTCGKPSCRCASDPAARHGPYYQWIRMRPDGHPNSSTCGHLKLLHPERGLTMG